MPGFGEAKSTRLRVVACKYDGDETRYGGIKNELDSRCG